MKPIVIVPYRDREEHLEIFVPHIKEFIPNCEVVVVEQDNDKPFNRGKLLNIGFIYSLSEEERYFIFHDVDMLPVSADYSYPIRPTHIATRVSQFQYKMPFRHYFGGVTLFNKQDFIDINGYMNDFWGWGSEDDELIFQLQRRKTRIDRRICYFESLQHERIIDKKLYDRNRQLANRTRRKKTGLDYTIYTLNEVVKFPNYTLLKVDI